MNKLFITGSTGFVGRCLLRELSRRNIDFVAGSRTLYGDLLTKPDWLQLIKGCDTIVHLAARVHVMNEHNSDPLKTFRAMNVDVTLDIANSAKALGVKRFIFISSVKVNGEKTYGIPFRASDTPSPADPYGMSKMEAEVELMKLHSSGFFEVVIIRPPLIYGQGVKANFEKLFYFVQKDLPIPFRMVKNKRSLVSVLNLVDLIICCGIHPAASGKVFMVSDDNDLSLPGLIKEMASLNGKTPHLIPVPVGLMIFVATLLGRKDLASRLFGDLQVDISDTKRLLGWKPTFSFKETFERPLNE